MVSECAEDFPIVHWSLLGNVYGTHTHKPDQCKNNTEQMEATFSKSGPLMFRATNALNRRDLRGKRRSTFSIPLQVILKNHSTTTPHYFSMSCSNGLVQRSRSAHCRITLHEHQKICSRAQIWSNFGTYIHFNFDEFLSHPKSMERYRCRIERTSHNFRNHSVEDNIV